MVDVVFADDAAPGRVAEDLAIGGAVVDGLVDHVPALDPAAVATGDGADVIAHAPKQDFARGGFAVVAFENPARGLAVPDEGVADHGHVVLLAEQDVVVGRAELVAAGLRVDDRPLHVVLGREGGKFA